MRKDRLDREGRPKPKPSKLEKFRVVIGLHQGNDMTVPRDLLLKALDECEAQGKKWIVVKA